MNLTEIKKTALPNHRPKRVGRGPRSGHGKQSGRGNKGAKARSGYSGQQGYEGGQTPLFRRLPKRGFNNFNFRREFTVVNVGDLKSFAAGAEVTPETLAKAGLVRKASDSIKVLGGGGIDVPLKVSAHKFSEAAAQKIKDAGGEVKEL